MRIILCDGCKKNLENQRFDRVEVRNRRLDLCRECYPRYQEFEKAVDDLAKTNEDGLNRALHELTEKFWEEMNIGSETTPWPNRGDQGTDRGTEQAQNQDP